MYRAFPVLRARAVTRSFHRRYISAGPYDMDIARREIEAIKGEIKMHRYAVGGLGTLLLGLMYYQAKGEDMSRKKA